MVFFFRNRQSALVPYGTGKSRELENYLAMNYKKAGTVLIKDNGSLGIPRYPMPGMERPVWIPAHIVFTRKPLLYTTP